MTSYFITVHFIKANSFDRFVSSGVNLPLMRPRAFQKFMITVTGTWMLVSGTWLLFLFAQLAVLLDILYIVRHFYRIV